MDAYPYIQCVHDAMVRMLEEYEFGKMHRNVFLMERMVKRG